MAEDDVLNAELEPQFSSRDYGSKEASVSVCWTVKTAVPFTAQFLLVPVRPNENADERLESAIGAIGNWQSTIGNN
jgi:hypothetical protein